LRLRHNSRTRPDGQALDYRIYSARSTRFEIVGSNDEAVRLGLRYAVYLLTDPAVAVFIEQLRLPVNVVTEQPRSKNATVSTHRRLQWVRAGTSGQ
jgi:hypothetical protein